MELNSFHRTESSAIEAVKRLGLNEKALGDIRAAFRRIGSAGLQRVTLEIAETDVSITLQTEGYSTRLHYNRGA